jgi:hypothetical protein
MPTSFPASVMPVIGNSDPDSGFESEVQRTAMSDKEFW